MYKRFLKRVLDIIFALVTLPILIILLFVLGPIIYFQDRGFIFYIAPRLGMNGKIFKMYKFRTMKINAPDIRNEDGSTFSAENDERLTKVGRFIRKTSLDETPQLLNVIMGDMSIIGPRPDLPEHHKLYEGNENKKLEVRPGITGYNQVKFRNSVPWKERIQNDIYYIDKLTFWFDVKILFKTIESVIFKKGVFAGDQTASDSRLGDEFNA